MQTSQQTKDHECIRQWIDERRGEPAVLRMAPHGGNRHSLRIKFEEEEADELQTISWNEFFKIFDDGGFVFFYDMAKESRFNKFIETEAGY